MLVGAQAVYIHAGEGDLAVAPFTTDSDLAIDPRKLGSEPLIEFALGRANFRPADGTVGIWEISAMVGGVSQTIAVDLLVPESIGGPGRRGARIPPHAKSVARKVSGLEGALVDRDIKPIRALDSDDRRQIELAVAGPAALLVAKTHKILDRTGSPDRLSDKDALDVYRLLRALPTDDLVRRFRTMFADDVSRASAERAMDAFPGLFASPNARGCQMAVRAAGLLGRDATLAASLAALAQDLIAGIRDA